MVAGASLLLFLFSVAHSQFLTSQMGVSYGYRLGLDLPTKPNGTFLCCGFLTGKTPTLSRVRVCQTSSSMNSTNNCATPAPTTQQSFTKAYGAWGTSANFSFTADPRRAYWMEMVADPGPEDYQRCGTVPPTQMVPSSGKRTKKVLRPRFNPGDMGMGTLSPYSVGPIVGFTPTDNSTQPKQLSVCAQMFSYQVPRFVKISYQCCVALNCGPTTQLILDSSGPVVFPWNGPSYFTATDMGATVNSLAISSGDGKDFIALLFMGETAVMQTLCQ
jgi:hypothetical protein